MGERTDVSQTFFIKAPPKPAICATTYCEVDVTSSPLTKIGDVSYNMGAIQSTESQPGVSITLRAPSSSVSNPSIIKGAWSVKWFLLTTTYNKYNICS
jgi:hypothetical protein